jgi:hypothetical protein
VSDLIVGNEQVWLWLRMFQGKKGLELGLRADPKVEA